ncbi:MAG: endonuclease Q family protein [Candidatus Eremiobacteraeota bacterium]|nr:endonuclease Q family protein [Candidatus Eremiobacteraeota bacterium]
MPMKHYFADFHVHIGSTSEGRPVKVTASRKLTFSALIEECYRRKGIDMVGVVDCASPGVLSDIDGLIGKGVVCELPEGGLIHRDRVTVILGAEVECVEDGGGVSHHIAYFPYLRQMKEFSALMRRHIKNIELSSQSCGIPARELNAVIKATGGIHVPAHAFTPHKSVYGRACRRLSELFPEEGHESVAAIELGLSADSSIADMLEELAEVCFLSNSDAHSAGRIGREYNILAIEAPTFQEMVLAFRRVQGRSLVANFGLDPRLGRYHRSYCTSCRQVATGPPPILSCPLCGARGGSFAKGVLDRAREIGDFQEPRHPDHRPPYHHQIPLELVPGLKSALMARLIEHFGSEMAVLHTAEKRELVRVVGLSLAADIVRAREGSQELVSGGGGHYGKVRGAKSHSLQLTFSFDT